MVQEKIEAWYLGIDMGTGSCKSVIVDEQAHVLGFGVGNYTAGDAKAEWQEHDPQAILAGMLRSVRAARADAVSFAVMQERSIEEAFTFDSHFATMGYRMLPD
jgi:sugar (pentulose or hexulose) kinase